MKIKVINTTTDSYEIAYKIAKLLVSERLSPCVQTVPKIKSTYMWEGKLEKSDEILLVIKTIPEKVQDCKKIILKYQLDINHKPCNFVELFPRLKEK